MIPLMIGGMAVQGAMSLAGGLINQGAARDAEAAQLGQLDLARQANQNATQQAQQLFNPYQLYGQGALQFMQNRILSSTERKMASVSQRNSLMAEVQRLSTPTDWASFPNLTGEKASERKAAMWQQQEAARQQQLQAATHRLQAYDTEQQALAPLYAQQEAELSAQQGRIDSALNRISNVRAIDGINPFRAPTAINMPQNLAQIRADMANDPLYKFQQESGERAINRAAANRGQYFSGAAIGQISDFNMQLGAQETQRYYERTLAGEQARFNSELAGESTRFSSDLQAEQARYSSELGSAQAALAGEMGASQQDIDNMMKLANMGLSAAQGQANVGMAGNQVNAQLQTQAGQAMAQSEMAQGQAISGALQGIGSAVGQTAGTIGGLGMMASLMRPQAALEQGGSVNPNAPPGVDNTTYSMAPAGYALNMYTPR